ncbi:MAG TPA: CheR family methyltransferase [Chthoniobacterales bacterium]|nr:CheR family methyltransferase [Chthoniobacterales bacterium]
MSIAPIIALLRQTIGLDIASVGLSLIERAVSQRLRANDLCDISQYTELLQRSQPELQSLVEVVVIPETFFFRYPESFAALQQIVGKHVFAGKQNIRVLSVACSTGEEPYSIAMALLDAGLSPDKFQIDATDVSPHLLDIGRFGVFGSNSFRGSNLKFRDQYFQKTDAGFRLCERVRQSVKFERRNVLEETSRFGGELYDFIFCRNLLIYFDGEAQRQTLKSLSEFLTANGVLFVGSSETGLLTQHGFSSVRLPMAFAFRKSEPAVFHTPPKHRPPTVWKPAKTYRSQAVRRPDLATLKKPIPETVKHKKELPADLALAEQLADQGQLKEAIKICELSLLERGPSARAFHLLGLIRDCEGDQQQATEFYRKALYLEPDHYDSLIHLALLADKNGDSAAAKALKDRAHRVLERRK